MEDVQSYSDTRRIEIDRVGVRGLRYPIQVLDRDRGMQETVATISMAVRLPHHFKGTHMSRFIEVLNGHRGEVTMRTLPSMLEDIRDRLDARGARVEVRFPYFMERVAPVSEATSLMEYECTLTAVIEGEAKDFTLGVNVPVTTLCPCSKAISEYGAHNQRGYVEIAIRSRTKKDGRPELVWIEELVHIAEDSASSPVYPLLKRADERFVTMQAYDNPMFVEDLVREVSQKLRDDERVVWHRVVVETMESIHDHNAYAEVVWGGPDHEFAMSGPVASSNLKSLPSFVAPPGDG